MNLFGTALIAGLALTALGLVTVWVPALVMGGAILGMVLIVTFLRALS